MCFPQTCYVLPQKYLWLMRWTTNCCWSSLLVSWLVVVGFTRSTTGTMDGGYSRLCQPLFFFLLQLRMNFLRHKPLEPQFQPSTNICLSWLLCLVLFPYCCFFSSWRLWLDWWCSGFEHVWDVNENMLLHEIFLNGIVLSSWKGGPGGVWLTDWVTTTTTTTTKGCSQLVWVWEKKSVPPSAAFP